MRCWAIHEQTRVSSCSSAARASFSGIDGIDYLVAASAVVADADLLTSNVRHYPMFDDLAPPY